MDNIRNVIEDLNNSLKLIDELDENIIRLSSRAIEKEKECKNTLIKLKRYKSAFLKNRRKK
jgi:hypothetical protein